MDFRSIGTMQGFGAAIRQQARAADEAIEHANEIIANKNEIIRRLRTELAEARTALAIETAHSAGLMAQAAAAKGELLTVAPASSLFTETGKKFQNGKSHTAFSVVYENAFDGKALELGIESTDGLRAKAV